MPTINYDDSRRWYKTGRRTDTAAAVHGEVLCPLCGAELEDGGRSRFCEQCTDRGAADESGDPGLFDDPDALYLSEYESED